VDSKCILGDVDIRLCLRDIRRIRGSHASIWSMARLVDNIFACISGSADRWCSSKFDLSTENPIVFHRVQLHCSALRTPHPTTLKLAYVYMLGYSLFTMLFSCAMNMRVLCLGPMKPLDISPNYTLLLSSLRILDIEFFGPFFVGHLLESIEAPSLSDLVVRRVCDGVPLLIQCPRLLSWVTSFLVHLGIRDDASLH
jgi:hypothetical protein